MQDQAFLGPESGLAVPATDGGIDLYVATQWLHVDQRQVCQALGLDREGAAGTLAGVGGAFRRREDLSMHVHACLLALHTGKPVKMSYTGRSRSSATCTGTRRGCATSSARTGRHPGLCQGGHPVRRRRVRLLHRRGGGHGGTMGWPVPDPSVEVDCYGVYTNNPRAGDARLRLPCSRFAHEALMDELADTVGLDRIAIRQLNGMREATGTSPAS